MSHNTRQTTAGRNTVKSSSPNVSSTSLILLCPHTHVEKRQNPLLSHVWERNYTVNVQCSVQYTLLLLHLMLVTSSVLNLSIKP
jgi:hypothetical protein